MSERREFEETGEKLLKCERYEKEVVKRRGVIFSCLDVADSFTHEICPYVHSDCMMLARKLNLLEKTGAGGFSIFILLLHRFSL